MPYRRLPNTDKARVTALKTVIYESDQLSFNEQIVSGGFIHEAKSFLNLFEQKMGQYQQALDTQVAANKHYQELVAKARLYVSHFIQVLNLCVIREDIKKEYKLLYQLDPDTHIVPDLSTENTLLHWGKCVIDGEMERTRNGGVNIQNPSIAKVKVHYDIFKEYKSTQKQHQAVTNRCLEELAKLRSRGDDIILEIWNQIDEYFKNERPYTRLKKCQQFGVIYYYRKSEPHLTPADDIEPPQPLNLWN